MNYTLNILETATELAINIENVISQNYIEYAEGDFTRRWVVKGLNPNFQTKEIVIEYCLQKLLNGEVLSSDPYDFSAVGAYDAIYGIISPEPLGVAITKHLMNGILNRHYGVRCFGPDGTFYQYELPEPEPEPEEEEIPVEG